MRDAAALHSRVQVISEALTDPEIPEDLLEYHYAELKEIGAQLSAEDAQRRNQVITFSNGLALTTAEVAKVCAKTSIADFCIQTGLARAEVLERTGLAKAGVS